MQLNNYWTRGILMISPCKPRGVKTRLGTEWLNPTFLWQHGKNFFLLSWISFHAESKLFIFRSSSGLTFKTWDSLWNLSYQTPLTWDTLDVPFQASVVFWNLPCAESPLCKLQRAPWKEGSCPCFEPYQDAFWCRFEPELLGLLFWTLSAKPSSNSLLLEQRAVQAWVEALELVGETFNSKTLWLKTTKCKFLSAVEVQQTFESIKGVFAGITREYVLCFDMFFF